MHKKPALSKFLSFLKDLPPRNSSSLCLKEFSSKVKYLYFSRKNHEVSGLEEVKSYTKIILEDIKKEYRDASEYTFIGKTVKDSMKNAIAKTEISHTKNYLVFLDKERDLHDTEKVKYEKFLASHYLSEVNHGWCIEKLMIILTLTLLVISTLGIIFDFTVSLEHKKLFFFWIVTIAALVFNFLYIKRFYHNLYTNEQTQENIFPYYRDKTKNNKFNYMNYVNYKPDMYKLYPTFIAGYFLIIVTFTFYVSSLMVAPKNNLSTKEKVAYVK